MKLTRVMIIVSLILTIVVGLSGCGEKPLPTRVGEVATYNANMDADAEDELVTWFTVMDNEGKEIKASGIVSYTFLAEVDSKQKVFLSQTRQVTEKDFVRAKVGLIPALEREKVLCAFHFDTESFTPQTCPICGGGEQVACTECGGMGYTDCTICEGASKKDCYSCDGSGNCLWCDGVGYEECTFCDGTGKEECYSCDGSGDCFWCDGTGVWLGSTCSSCGGTGRCTSCNGTGYLTCTFCDGTGQEACYSCDGSGNCSTCGGTGKIACSWCNGTGKEDCFWCDGAGLVACMTCDGKGTIDPRGLLVSLSLIIDFETTEGKVISGKEEWVILPK